MIVLLKLNVITLYLIPTSGKSRSIVQYLNS